MITLSGITKKYGEKTVFENLNLSIKKGEITAVLGESGSGKTTLLNIIASLTDFTGVKDGLFSKPVSFVFQRDRLAPNLTVKENLLLTCKGADVSAALARAGLGGCENYYPKSLSAGMARRVALLRAFLFKSEIVLMDEPFVNLDPALKYALMDEFKSMQEKDGRTAVFVTHDVKEAVYLADRALILSGGAIIYDKPDVCADDENEILSLMLKIGRKN